MDENFVAAHREEALGVGHAGVVVGAGVSRSGSGQLPQCCGCGLENVEHLRIGRISVRVEVEAEPTGTPEGQVRSEPPDRVAHVRNGLPNVPGQVTGLDSPIVLDVWLECTSAGGGGREGAGAEPPGGAVGRRQALDRQPTLAVKR